MVTINNEKTAANLKELLGNRTQSWLAGEMGVSRETVKEWMHGRNVPTLLSTVNLCEIFCCDVEDIIATRVCRRVEE